MTFTARVCCIATISTLAEYEELDWLDKPPLISPSQRLLTSDALTANNVMAKKVTIGDH